MVSITTRGTWLPPGPSRYARFKPWGVRASAGKSLRQRRECSAVNAIVKYAGAWQAWQETENQSNEIFAAGGSGQGRERGGVDHPLPGSRSAVARRGRDRTEHRGS